MSAILLRDIDVRGELLSLLDKFFPALASALDGSEADQSVRSLATVVGRTDGLAAALREAAKVRPTAEARAYLGVTEALRDVWATYLKAVTVADVRRAQALASHGQTALDGSTSALKAFDVVTNAARALADFQATRHCQIVYSTHLASVTPEPILRS